MEGIELRRLARAVHLDATRLPDGSWLVNGGALPHWVRGRRCDCHDFLHHGGPCKHQLAVRLRTGDPEAIHSLREIVPMPEPGRASATAVEGRTWA